jgi:CheY-like chemotaxis protein
MHGLLFREFSQIASVSGRQSGGTGLGLVISKRLAELMGGKIGFTSKVGGGSTFWFTLPAHVPVPAGRPGGAGLGTQPAPASDPLPFADRHLRVLLAEDDPMNQKLMLHLLTKLSCQVDVAVNGSEATALCARNQYDLVFMDCLMPVMDGWEAARRIRRLQAGQPRVPIIATTASLMPEQRKRCQESGMDDILEKPIQNQVLKQIISKWASARPTA